MDYMPILPIGMFDIFNNRSSFILPQFWFMEEYANFYRRNKWKIVIIDNAMYEQKDMFDFKSMINIAKMLRAEKIFLVLPEDHDNPYNTPPMACDCLSDNPSDGSWQPMTILHGDEKSVRTQYDQLRSIDGMGFGVAVSLWRAGINRSMIFKHDEMKSNYFHAMGLDNIDELPLLRNGGYRSVDSSIVASAAWNNINLRKDREIIRTGSKNDPERVSLKHPAFSIVLKNEAKRNIALLNALCEG